MPEVIWQMMQDNGRFTAHIEKIGRYKGSLVVFDRGEEIFRETVSLDVDEDLWFMQVSEAVAEYEFAEADPGAQQ